MIMVKTACAWTRKVNKLNQYHKKKQYYLKIFSYKQFNYGS